MKGRTAVQRRVVPVATKPATRLALPSDGTKSAAVTVWRRWRRGARRGEIVELVNDGRALGISIRISEAEGITLTVRLNVAAVLPRVSRPWRGDGLRQCNDVTAIAVDIDKIEDPMQRKATIRYKHLS